MRQFDYTEKWKKLLTPEIVGYLTTIHEYKGEQRLIAERHADVLERIIISLYSIVALIIEQGKQQGKIDVDIEYEVVNDRYFTPINFVNLFDYPDLILCYGKLEFNKIKYLQYQFDAPIFSNKYLGDYVFNKNNLISVFVVNLLNGFN